MIRLQTLGQLALASGKTEAYLPRDFSPRKQFRSIKQANVFRHLTPSWKVLRALEIDFESEVEVVSHTQCFGVIDDFLTDARSNVDPRSSQKRFEFIQNR